MKRFLPFAAPLVFLLLSACTDTTGLSPDSSRTPKGNPDAAIVVEEFADLQCPACRAAQGAIVQPLLQRYEGQIRFEFVHFPLCSIHRFALDAAEGAECAADQGKFWEFVDLDYENQPELNTQSIERWGESLELDMGLFRRCVKSDIKRKTILADYEEGRERDVNGTPTFFINRVLVETDLEKMFEVIEEALKNQAARL